MKKNSQQKKNVINVRKKRANYVEVPKTNKKWSTKDENKKNKAK